MKTLRTFLRLPELEDIDILYKWENDEDNWKISLTEKPISKLTLENYINSTHKDLAEIKNLRLMICDVNNKEERIGSVEFFDLEPIHRRAGIGILIDQKYRRKGIAKEVIQKFETYLIDVLNLKQIYCLIHLDNIKSINLFKSLDYKKSGLLKEWLYFKQKFHDVVLFQKSLTKN